MSEIYPESGEASVWDETRRGSILIMSDSLLFSFPQPLKASPYGLMPPDKDGLTTGSVRFVHIFHAVVFDTVNVRQIH